MSVVNRVPLFLPEHLILRTANIILEVIRTDYRNHLAGNSVEESMLHLLLGNQSVGKVDLLREAVKIFITTPQDPKHFDVKLSFDKNPSKAPQVFITQPAENDRNNSIDVGVGDQSELLITSDDQEDQYREQYMRRYSATQYLMIVCENRMEMTIIYNVMKSMLVSCFNHFSTEGLSNLKLGGQELKMRGEIPDELFQKAIIMNYEYEQVSPSIVIQNVFRKIRLYWRATEATDRQGPIEFETDDDLSDSSS